MLRKIRIGISVVLFALITFYFLDFANILPNSFHRLAHIQFVPAVLSLSIGILIVLIALTLLFGRIYCSTICPMGIWQDVIARISKSVGKKKKRYRYSPAKNMLRWTVLGVTVIASVCGFSVVLGLLDPYSAYGRIVVHIFKPVYMLGNNLLESVFSRFDNYTFYQVDTSVLSLSSLLIAILTFAAILILAWKHGRTWCNTICPVGTVLGFLSRYSLFKVRIDTAKCNGCGLCATKCKAACIHSKEHAIDYSRCVDCFDNNVLPLQKNNRWQQNHLPLLQILPNVVFCLPDWLLPEQLPRFLQRRKNPLRRWKAKRHTKKKIRLLLRDLSARSVSSNIVHHAIFVSANARRMY